MINHRKLGQFVIEDNFFDDSNVMQQLMSRVIIVRCEHLYHKQCFDYTAICEDFDEVPRGQMIPSYDVIVHQQEDSSLSIEFKNMGCNYV